MELVTLAISLNIHALGRVLTAKFGEVMGASSFYPRGMVVGTELIVMEDHLIKEHGITMLGTMAGIYSGVFD